MNGKYHRAKLVCAVSVFAAAWTLTASPLVAEEIVLQNDSLKEGDQGCIVGDFVPGEEAAVWLTVPTDGEIVAIQILWWSIDRNAPFTIERNIWIREPGEFPNVGDALLQLEGPKLTPFFLNEFRYVDENQQIPISVPVEAGQTIVVSLEYENRTDIRNGSPSIVRDIDGCQAQKNAIFAIPGDWIDWCSFPQVCGGRPGDFVIRAVLEQESQRRTLAVRSDMPGALVDAGNGYRETPFDLDDLTEGDKVVLTAFAFSPGGDPFVHWKLDGKVVTEKRKMTVRMNVGEDRTAKAIYQDAIPRTLFVESNAPGALVDPGGGFRQTPFVLDELFEGDVLDLRAFAVSPQGDPFSHWQLDGEPAGEDPVLRVEMTAGRDRTAKVFYEGGGQCDQLLGFKAKGKRGKIKTIVDTTLDAGKATVDCVGDNGSNIKTRKIKSNGRAKPKIKNLAAGKYTCTLTRIKDGQGKTLCEGDLASENVRVKE